MVSLVIGMLVYIENILCIPLQSRQSINPSLNSPIISQPNISTYLHPKLNYLKNRCPMSISVSDIFVLLTEGS